MDIERKDLPLHLTAIKASGDGTHTLEGYASVFGGQPDSYGDVILKGAFAESLRQRTPKLLWQHDSEVPIGKALSLEEDDHGLFGRWQLANTQKAQEAFLYVSEGLVEGLSIGFITQESEYDAQGNRLLKKLDLREISTVTMPANERALISGFKTAVPFTTLLEQAGEVFGTVTREAKALRDRRTATNRVRPLNDQHRQAIEDYLAEVKTLHEELSALVVAEPEAKAPDFREIEASLAAARQRYYGHLLKESA